MEIMLPVRLFFFKCLLGAAGVGAIAYGIICLALLGWQNRLIFFPSPVLENTPSYLGLAYEDVWIPWPYTQGKQERLHAWWIPAAMPKSNVLLYLHGNGINISANLGQAQRFHQLGFSVLLMDYRGYGRSTGKFPTEAAVYRDAQITWDYLLQQRSIQPQDIFIYGHSLGGAIDIDLAVRKPQAAGLIVENSLTCMRDIINHQRIYRFFPADLLLTQRFDSLSKLKLLQIPLLLIHGLDDRMIPAWMSQVLFKAATVPKKLLLVPDASHNDVASVAGDKYLQTVRDFYQFVRVRQHQIAVDLLQK